MPGIPLKIYRPQLEVILAESRGKRVDFLQEVIAQLRLRVSAWRRPDHRTV